jgi:hypothetical protein
MIAMNKILAGIRAAILLEQPQREQAAAVCSG